MTNIFFTSDTHFGHANILKLGNGRPFASIEDHDEALVQNWNKKVRPGDTIYHLGDTFFRADEARIRTIFDRLNGQKHLVHGNHDNAFMKGLSWESSLPYRTIKVGGTYVILFHYPIREWEHFWRGSYHLHGHVHGEHYDTQRSCDVGVDRWNWTPAAWEEIVERCAKSPRYNPKFPPMELLPTIPDNTQSTKP